MPVLIFETGAAKGTTIRLEPDRVYTLGRDERAEVRIDNELVSRVHAKLRGKDGHFYLKDADSSNGTLVNDVKIAGVHQLGSGDRIEICGEVVSFFDDQEAGGAAGKSLGGFQLIQRLGRGGMGTVYRAMQKSLSREIALKILAPELSRDHKFVEQFLKEARAAGQLNHPNIVQVYDVEEDAGLVFYAMELMRGGTVEDRINKIAKDGPISIEQGVQWLHEAASGLQYAELKKIVHRDIKPDNLMLTDIGSVKIADLGLALSTHEGHGDIGIHGTPHFISPEQARGEKPDTRSDLYSLGATFFRVFTGRTVFTGESAQDILRKQVKEPAPSVKSLRGDVPEKVAAIVAKMLAKDPAERFQTVADLLAAIDEARARRSRMAGVAIALMLVLVGAAGAGWKLGWFGPHEPATVVVQQTVVNEDDAQKARAAEERAKKMEAENKALAAIGDLRQKRATLGDDAYLVALEDFAKAYVGTDSATNVAPEIEALRQEIATKRAAAESRSVAIGSAIEGVQAAVDPAIRDSLFGAAYTALTNNAYGPPEILADEAFVKARDAARARIDQAVADSGAAFDRALADALARNEFAAARAAVEGSTPAFGGTDTIPDSESAGRDAMLAIAARIAAAPASIDAAEAAWRVANYAGDLHDVLAALPYPIVYQEMRAWKDPGTGPLAVVEAAMRTAEYRAYVANLRADFEAFASTVAAVRETIERGGAPSSKVKHPERGANGEILGMGPDGQSVVIEVARGVSKAKAPVAFAMFDYPVKFANLVDGRIQPTPKNALAAVRATLAFAAAALAPAVQRATEQIAKYDPATGWKNEQRAELNGLVIPTIDPAQLEPWLAIAEADSSTTAAARDLRGRVQREARALDLLASALLPFAKEDSDVRFGLAADQLEVIAEELRGTHTFFVAYPLFDDGTKRLPLVLPPTPQAPDPR